jgi:glycine reductase complex component B subunit alpha and beta
MRAVLPRVAYLYHIYSHRDMRDTFYYGEKPRHLIPTLIHPNEVFDGAIVTGNYDMPPGMKNETIFIQNHPIIKELYRRHGKDLLFVGVVIANEHATMKEKEKSAVLSAKLIKHVLGADAVLITQTGGGHPNIDLMLCCRMCEQQGVKTVVMVSEESSADGSEFSLTMMVPEADAVVSTGNINEEVALPPVNRVIGGNSFRRKKEPPGGALRVPYHMIPGSTSQIGGANLTTFPC